MSDYKCTCDEDYVEDHTCPFAEEIDGDSETQCNCCDYCTEQCAWNI